MPKLIVHYCRICGKEIKHGQICELCCRILANVRRAKYTANYSETLLYDVVRKHPLFVRFRSGYSPDSVPLRIIPGAVIKDRK